MPHSPSKWEAYLDACFAERHRKEREAFIEEMTAGANAFAARALDRLARDNTKHLPP